MRPSTPSTTDDAALNNFSHCTTPASCGIWTRSAGCRRCWRRRSGHAVAENIVKFFRAAAPGCRKVEELFTTVLADARPGEERERVQAAVALLTREHRDIEAQWNLLEPQLKKLARASRRRSMARRCAAWC